MPDDGSLAVPPDELEQFSDASSARYDRPSLVGFVTDARSEEALRDGLSEVTVEQLDLRRGGVRAAVAAMQKSATPKVLVVDPQARVSDRQVVLGSAQGDRWIVSEGLAPGERVVVEGLQHVKAGDQVQVDNASGASPIAQHTGQ